MANTKMQESNMNSPFPFTRLLASIMLMALRLLWALPWWLALLLLAVFYIKAAELLSIP